MLDHYIGYLTNIYIVDHDVPPEKLDDYHDYVLMIKSEATRLKDLEPLKLGIDYLLCHREIDLDGHGGLYPYDDEEVRDILQYIRSIVWSNNSKINCKEVENIKLINTSDIDWWKTRGITKLR